MLRRLLFVYCAALVALCLSQETALSSIHSEKTTPNQVSPDLSRPKRQIALFQLPRLIFTFFRVLRETRNDTRSAYRQISKILSDSIVDESATKPPPPEGANDTSAASDSVITRQELLRIARLNIRGLVRLFNQEVDIAVNDSYRNVAETRAEFRESLRQALRPVTTTTTTARTTTSTTTSTTATPPETNDL